MNTAAPQNLTIVLLHGFGGGRWWMRPLARRLEEKGWNCHLYRYPAWFSRIETEGKRFADWLRKDQQVHTDSAIHLIGHSMGCIVARSAIAYLPSHAIESMVMVCPPNRGSHVAGRFSPWLGKFVPMLSELSDQPSSYVNQLPDQLPFPVGIVAAEGDLVIHPEATRLPYASDFLTVPGMHGAAVWREDVAQATDRFFRTGHFASNPTLSADSPR